MIASLQCSGVVYFSALASRAYAELMAAGYSLKKGLGPQSDQSVPEKTEQEACAVDSSVLFG